MNFLTLDYQSQVRRDLNILTQFKKVISLDKSTLTFIVVVLSGRNGFFDWMRNHVKENASLWSKRGHMSSFNDKPCSISWNERLINLNYLIIRITFWITVKLIIKLWSTRLNYHTLVNDLCNKSVRSQDKHSNWAGLECSTNWLECYVTLLECSGALMEWLKGVL